MKVVHFITAFPVGGAESMLVDILNQQIKDEKISSISLIILNDLIDDNLISKISDGIKIYKINRKIRSISPFPFLKLNTLLFFIRPDIIHLHNIELIRFLYSPAKKILTVHNTGLSTVGWQIFSAIYSISKCVKSELDSKHIPNKLIYNGIKVNDVKPNTKLCRPNIINLVQVSRLYVKQKGQDILIDVLAKLHKERINNFTMTFIGAGEDEEYLRVKVKELGLEEVISFIGVRDRKWVYDNLCNFNVLIQPSRFEGFGLTVAEACLAKCITVISNIEGPMEILNNGEYGVTFQNKNPDDLYRVLKKLLTDTNYYSDCLRKCEQAYSYAKSNFDIEKTSVHYVDEYNRLLK